MERTHRRLFCRFPSLCFIIQGCDINSNSSDGIEAAVDLAKMSDIIVYIGGLSAAVSREGLDRSDLKVSNFYASNSFRHFRLKQMLYVQLPGIQPELVSMLASIGKPMAGCLVNRAPLSFNVTSKIQDTILLEYRPLK